MNQSVCMNSCCVSNAPQIFTTSFKLSSRADSIHVREDGLLELGRGFNGGRESSDNTSYNSKLTTLGCYGNFVL